MTAIDNEQSPLLGTDFHSDTESTLSAHDTSCSKTAGDADGAVLPETSTVGRQIGLASAYILIVSRVIGSGIFAMPGIILQSVGSPGMALSLWVIGALVACTGLAISIEYGAMLPRSGGVKVYLEYTYRYPRFLASTLVAVQAVLLGFTASNCIVFAKYILYACDIQPSDVSTKLLAVGLLTAITLLHGCFYKTGLWIQNALGWLKIGLTVFMVVTGFAVLLSKPAPQQTWSNPWADSNMEWNTLSTAFFKILYSFAGFENVNNVMDEVKNPIRTIKSVGPAGLATACVLYVLVNIAYLSVVPIAQIKQSKELIAALFFERLGFGRAVLPVAIALSAAGNVMVVTFSLARLNQEMARKGFLPFPELFASNAPFGSPFGGLVVHYIPSLLVIVLPPASSVYSFIADIEGYAGQFFALAIAIGLIVLRYREPDMYRPFRAWLPAVWLRIVLASFLILAPWFPPRGGASDVEYFYATYALVGLAVLLFGVVYWFFLAIAIPSYQGCKLEEASDTLKDGTTIMRLVCRPLEDLGYSGEARRGISKQTPTRI